MKRNRRIKWYQLAACIILVAIAAVYAGNRMKCMLYDDYFGPCVGGKPPPDPDMCATGRNTNLLYSAVGGVCRWTGSASDDCQPMTPQFTIVETQEEWLCDFEGDENGYYVCVPGHTQGSSKETTKVCDCN